MRWVLGLILGFSLIACSSTVQIVGENLGSKHGEVGERTPTRAEATDHAAAGDDHSCALTNSGEALWWGDNDYGQSSPPEGTFSAITAGRFHSCALTNSGEALCWGSNGAGQSSPPASFSNP